MHPRNKLKTSTKIQTLLKFCGMDGVIHFQQSGFLMCSAITDDYAIKHQLYT